MGCTKEGIPTVKRNPEEFAEEPSEDRFQAYLMEQVPKPKGGLRPIAIGDGIGPGRCPRTFLPCTD